MKGVVLISWALSNGGPLPGEQALWTTEGDRVTSSLSSALHPLPSELLDRAPEACLEERGAVSRLR